MPNSHDSPNGGAPSEELVERLAPFLELIFRAFNVPPDEAEEILFDTFVALQYRRGKIADPERWILMTVVNRCSRSRREEPEKS